MNKLFVLSGASGSGKSSLLSKIVEENLCEQTPKYSSRERRSSGFDDVIHIKIDDLKKKCDVIYERYGTYYGINTEEIKKGLQQNNQILIISDIKAIETLKKHLGNDVLIIFIYLQDLSLDNLLKERYKLQLNDKESDELANHILSSRKIRNKKWLDSVPENIIKKIKDSFSNNERHQEFIKRCNSWVELDLEYEKNGGLFTSTIKGITVDELFDKFKNQIFKKYNK